MMWRSLICASLGVFVLLQICAIPPEFPKTPAWSGRSTIVTADGSWRRYEGSTKSGKSSLAYVESNDNGVTWSSAHACCELPGEGWGGMAALLDKDGEVHIFCIRPRSEGAGKIIAVERFLDLWYLKSTDHQTKWTKARRIHAGYIGAISLPIQLKSGRIVMPFGDWVGGRERAAPTGPIECTTICTDDRGETFQLSKSRLTSPVSNDYNGDKVGACEPAIVELNDGRVLMLMRTQAGWLYQSISDDGINWPAAVPSVLRSSTGPPSLLKLKDGSIFVSWNNCVMPPKLDGQGVYAGRDALHAAIADPELKTWRGFREIYRDLTRNLEPPKRGDRGTAYPESIPMKDGRIAITSGQGGRRALFYVDPAWILETSNEDRFANGVDNWCVFTQFGPAEGWWRNRRQGAEVIAHPQQPDAKVLHLRRIDEKDPDGAVWNFSNGRKGSVTIRFQLRQGSAGGSIALTDAFYDPIDNAGEQNAMILLPLSPGGKVGEGEISADAWHTLEISWDLDASAASGKLDGGKAFDIKIANATQTGIHYLRLRSAAKAVDPEGWLVESVSATIAKE